MNALLMRLAIECVRGWTWLYTWRMPPDHRAARRAEIDSDLWECQRQTAGDRRLGCALQILVRLLLGIPDDLGWRVEQAAEAGAITQGSVALAARVAGAALLLCALWVIDVDASRKVVPYFAAQSPRAILIDDFESGTLANWTVNRNGAGGWFIYVNGQTPPEPSRSDPNWPFSVPNPPQGKFAAVTDMSGPGSRILSRELRLDGRYVLHVTVFYVNAGEFASQQTLAYDINDTNQQFRIDLIAASAPVDSLAQGDVLANIFHTSPGDPDRREPADVAFDVSRWQGQTVRLRFASVDNRGPLRVGIDNIRLEPVAK